MIKTSVPTTSWSRSSDQSQRGNTRFQQNNLFCFCILLFYSYLWSFFCKSSACEILGGICYYIFFELPMNILHAGGSKRESTCEYPKCFRAPSRPETLTPRLWQENLFLCSYGRTQINSVMAFPQTSGTDLAPTWTKEQLELSRQWFCTVHCHRTQRLQVRALSLAHNRDASITVHHHNHHEKSQNNNLSCLVHLGHLLRLTVEEK